MRRGDIYWVENHGGVGSEYRGRRPCVIVSNDKANLFGPIVHGVMLTTRKKKHLPTHVSIRSSIKPSTACCDNLTVIDKCALGDYAGHVSPYEMRAIDRALAIQLGLKEV